LRADLHWSSDRGGMVRLLGRDGTELTWVPAADARFLRLLDGIRSVAEVAGSLGFSVERCTDLARLYLRAGALVLSDENPKRPSSQ
jgi:hypothetical protein